MVNIWSVGKNSDKYSEALEHLFNTGKTSTCLLSNYSVTLEYLVNEDEIMSKYPEEALEYLVATDEMSIVQIFLGTLIFGSHRRNVYCPNILGHLFKGFILEPGRHLQ